MDLKRYYKVVVKIQQCGFSILTSFILNQPFIGHHSIPQMNFELDTS